MNLQMISILAVLFSVLFGRLPIQVVSSSYQPKDHYRVQCGAPNDEHPWRSDDNQRFSTSDSTTTPVNILGNSLQPQYDNARIFWEPITYTFNLSSTGPIFLRLYFTPNTTYNNNNNNINPTMFNFSVLANNKIKLLTNFNPYLVLAYSTAHPKITDQVFDAGFAREFYLSNLNHAHLSLTFSPSATITDNKSFGFINGIEIVSAPNELYLHTPAGQAPNGVPYLTGGPDDYFTNFFNYSATPLAMETMIRLNVGGRALQPKQDDTGLFRTWSDDANLIDERTKGFQPYRPNQSVVKLTYPKETPLYAAPEEVYTTMRTLGKYTPGMKKQYMLNLNWTLEVDGGFNYSLRFHFCELLREVNAIGQVIFSISINNQTAANGFDIFREGGEDVPFYRDYVINLVDGVGKRVNLTLKLIPDYEQSLYADALLNGLEIFKLSKPDNSLAAPLPFSLQTNQKNPTVNRKKLKHFLPMVIGSVLGFVLLVSFLFLGFCYIRHRKKGTMTESSTLIKSSDNDTTSKMKSWIPIPMDYSTSTTSSIMSLSLPSDLCRRFTLSQIRAATYDFDNSSVIGKGGFGKVYKGTIDGIPAPVAIKRLNSTSKQGAREFLNEIEMLSKLRHMNLVSLIGYCEEQGEMILVYEYMSRGTLRDHLLYKSNGASNVNTPLSWKQRLMICIGSARGLHYLHAGSKQSIIHRDVKSTNILLDEKWNAKVSDFGLSKVGPASEAGFSHVSTAVKGSVGYLDPEYYRRQQLTDKSDVYSFGVVMFEVLCARTVVDLALPKGEVNLAMWAQSRYKSGNLHTIVDPNIKGQIAPECLNKFGETAELCVRDQGNERPSIGDVVWALEFALQLQLTADNDSFNTNISDGLVEEGLKNSVVVNRDSGDEGITNDDLFTNSGENCYHQGSSASETQTVFDQTKSASVFSEIFDPKGR